MEADRGAKIRWFATIFVTGGTRPYTSCHHSRVVYTTVSLGCGYDRGAGIRGVVIVPIDWDFFKIGSLEDTNTNTSARFGESASAQLLGNCK